MNSICVNITTLKAAAFNFFLVNTSKPILIVITSVKYVRRTVCFDFFWKIKNC